LQPSNLGLSNDPLAREGSMGQAGIGLTVPETLLARADEVTE